MPTRAIAPPIAVSASAGGSRAAARQVQFWDRIAAKYSADPIADLAGYEATLRRVQGLLSADQDVLEIGCGTGTTALQLAPFTRHLRATDVSTRMIAIARDRHAAASALVPQLSFAVADAEASLASEAEYDAVLAFNMLHLVPDLDQALARVVQALRPGGR